MQYIFAELAHILDYDFNVKVLACFVSVSETES